MFDFAHIGRAKGKEMAVAISHDLLKATFMKWQEKLWFIGKMEETPTELR